MAGSFQCSLVTPERAVFESDVVYANLPAHDGQMGILKDHAALLVQLGNGTLHIELPDGSHKHFDLVGGFAQMRDNRLSVLSEKASDRAEATAEA